VDGIEPARADEHFTNDQQGPSIAYQARSKRDRAISGRWYPTLLLCSQWRQGCLFYVHGPGSLFVLSERQSMSQRSHDFLQYGGGCREIQS
jgi:hypothetical protein